MSKGRSVESTDDGLRRRLFHRTIVIRPQPFLAFRDMAFRASLGSDKVNRRFASCGLYDSFRLIAAHEHQAGKEREQRVRKRGRENAHAGTVAQLLERRNSAVTDLRNEP
jgi:hypothetical protein